MNIEQLSQYQLDRIMSLEFCYPIRLHQDVYRFEVAKNAAIKNSKVWTTQDGVSFWEEGQDHATHIKFNRIIFDS